LLDHVSGALGLVLFVITLVGVVAAPLLITVFAPGFLGDQGKCRIYPVRPMLCRSVSSIDADACRRALTEAIFDEEPPVLMHQLQQELYEAIFCGFGAGLEQVGLDGRSFQVSGLVRYLLEHPQWERDYLRGERLRWGELY